MNPLVSVIVPHHLNQNQVYLDLCLNSILASKYDNLEVLCISDSVEPPKLPDDPRVIAYHRPDLNNATKKLNFGASQANGKYILLVSDDVALDPYCIKTLVNGAGDNMLLSNPMSNGDNGAHFFAHLEIPVKCTIEDFKPEWMKGVENPPVLIYARNFISFYCTMIPKAVWDKVGIIDESMDVRWNDADYCMRAAKLGIPAMVNLGAFALHFGDKTLPQCTTPEQYASCDEAFKNKWHSTQTQL